MFSRTCTYIERARLSKMVAFTSEPFTHITMTYRSGEACKYVYNCKFERATCIRTLIIVILFISSRKYNICRVRLKL